MAVRIVPVETKRQKKQFIDLEWDLNKNTPNWVGPLRMERKEILDTQKNPFFQHADIHLFLAYKEENLCGRIAAITNDNYNQFHGNNEGFWGFFESINDQDVANALFDAAANWLKEKGKDRMLGPENPSTNDEVGTLIDGFDTPPFIMMTHNPDYYPRLIETYGHTKAKDLYAWFATTEGAEKSISEKMLRVSGKILKKYDIKLRHINLKNLKDEIAVMKDIYNNAWSKNWGFVPLTDPEFDKLAKDLKPVADENLLFVAEKSGQPIAFSLTIPNVNEIFQKNPSGRLFPLGIFKLLLGLKKIKTVRVLVLGVKREYQFLGLGSIFYIETIRTAKKRGYYGGEMSWILEDNHPMNQAIESIGSKCYKTYRIYQYPLT